MSSAAPESVRAAARDDAVRTFVVREALAGAKDAGEAATAELYYRRYAVPVLEAAGLLDAPDPEEAILWGTVQVLLGMSLRHQDNVLDGQEAPGGVAAEARLAHAYLERAQGILHERARGWTPAHSSVHRQLFDYECEARAGEAHDLSTLWRRASLLCVLPEVDLAGRLRDAGLRAAYRQHLSLALLLADCDHAWKDLLRGPPTPVTRILSESRTRSSLDFEATARRLAWVRGFAEAERDRLALRVEAAGCARWAATLRADALSPP